MKKAEVDPIALEIRALSKKYKALNRENIRIIHQFCEYDTKRTTKVICIMEDIYNPISIIENLIKKPEQSEQIIAELQKKYEKKYGTQIQLEKAEQEDVKDKKQVFVLGYDFFEHVPKDCIMSIMLFLEPYSFFSFSISSKGHYDISKSEAKADYYKRLCTKLFKIQPPVLPVDCRFQKIRDYVLQHPLEYRPNTKNAVQNNLRQFIWKMDLNSFNLQAEYYKSFGSYENIFKSCPTINFNGYYICRDKYVRRGIKDEKNPIAPIHINYYYRYFRFIEDGSIIYHVRNRKLKADQILTFLSRKLLEDNQQKQSMIGEYIHFKDIVHVKAVQSHQIFGYELEIDSTDTLINNVLKATKYTLQLVDDYQQMCQNLAAINPLKQKLEFHYCHNIKIAQQNSLTIQASSL